MRVTIDTETGLLETAAGARPLQPEEAFRLLSRLWLRLGWSLEHWATFSWMGRQMLQLPDDALRLAEAVWSLAPEFILETGAYDGGGSLWLASLCRLRGRGRVVTVEREVRPGVREALEAAGVALIEGDSADPEVAARVRRMAAGAACVFVFLDSDHSRRHVAAELANYAPLVTPGSYVVVADSILPELAGVPGGEAQWRDDNPGSAAAAFLAAHPGFVRERPAPLFPARHDFGHLSYFANTWLRRSR